MLVSHKLLIVKQSEGLPIKIQNSSVNQVVVVNTDTLKFKLNQPKLMPDLYLKTKLSVVIFLKNTLNRQEKVWKKHLKVVFLQDSLLSTLKLLYTMVLTTKSIHLKWRSKLQVLWR